jgi:hypothetical protein
MKNHTSECSIGPSALCNCGAMEVKSTPNRQKFDNLTWDEQDRKRGVKVGKHRKRHRNFPVLLFGMNTVNK